MGISGWIVGAPEVTLPRVTLTGRSEVTVEGHSGLFSYETARIRVRTPLGILSVSGQGLTIQYFGAQDMAIRGRVDEIKMDGEA